MKKLWRDQRKWPCPECGELPVEVRVVGEPEVDSDGRFTGGNRVREEMECQNGHTWLTRLQIEEYLI